MNKFPHGINEILLAFPGVKLNRFPTHHPVTGERKEALELVCVYSLNGMKNPLTPIRYSKKALEVYCCSEKGKAEINKACGIVFPNWDAEHKEWRK